MLKILLKKLIKRLKKRMPKKENKKDNKITTNFKESEFLRGSGYNNWNEVPSDYKENIQSLCVQVLEPLRKEIGRPITIIAGGGLRTKELNERIGGAPKSQHLIGNAADIRVEGYSPKRLFKILDSLQKKQIITRGGLAWYDRFVHVDRRGQRARWRTPAMKKDK